MKNVIFIFLVMGLGITLSRFIFIDSYFQIENIEVEGEEKLSDEVILDWAKIPLGKSIFRLNLKAIEKKLESQPKIEKVIIKRLLPSRILIQIKERKPFVYLLYKEMLFEVGKEGVVIGKVEELQDLPVISGVSSLSDKERIKKGIEVVKFAQNRGVSFAEVNVENPEGIIGYLPKGIKVYIGEGKHLEYLSYLPFVLTENRKIEYVDLRFYRQIVIKQSS